VSKGPRWSAAELEYLERLAGDVPYLKLVKRFQDQAVRNGWPRRSQDAIAGRLQRSGLRMRPQHGQCLTTCGVAELIGCPCARVESWTRRKAVQEILQPIWIGGIRYMQRSDWKRLAHQMPQVLGGFSADGLFALLEDRDMAERIALEYPRPWHDTSIRCVETGKLYCSCRDAARDHHVTKEAIAKAIRERRPVHALGLTFEALRSAADEQAQLRTCSNRS
jgi:hypothetical protein